MIEIYQLQQLISVAENETLAAAAEQLYISHSTLSRSMKKLEEELNVTLFERKKKNKISLNENGKIAVEEAKKVIRQMHALEERIQSSDRNRRMISIASCAPAPLWTILPYLSVLFPDMATFSETINPDKIMDGLLAQKYQLIFTTDEPEDSDLFYQKCTEEQAVFLLPGEHPLAGSKTLTFHDFNKETLLVYGDTGLWQHIYEQHMPDAHFIIEKDWTSFQKLMDTSTLPVFITDIALQHFKLPQGKIPVKICDQDARQSYYCICLKKQKEQFLNFFDQLAVTG